MRNQEDSAERLFGEALDMHPEERRAFLDRECDGQPDLREVVEELLKENDRLQGFLSQPAFVLGDHSADGAAHQVLPKGTRLGSYSIVELLGRGGMGEVYRAHDAKLGRDVALKILPAEMARDSQSIARLEREARTLAALNHPNIAAIHGLEEADGLRALVMELVEGKTLAEHLRGPAGAARKPLPAEEALPIARQIAEALEYAHERGVVHRDLKPANLKITPDGTVKVLDFGVAKVLRGQDSAPVDAMSSPTPSVMATEAGMILGTAAYMAPEQAKGKQVDRRADIWAFGCVLFEMLAGKKAFEGETISDVLAAVIKSDPEWTALPETTPLGIQRLMRRCLVKDPKQRLRDIGEARIAIVEALSGAATDAEAAIYHSRIAEGKRASLLRRALPWALGATTIFFALIAAWLLLKPTSQPNVIRLSVLPPENAEFFNGGEMSLSPDGHYLAFIAQAGTDKPTTLWLRPLGSLTAQPIPGIEDAHHPFWSPDSKWIGFRSEGKLEKVPVSGGAAQTLCNADGRGATWNRDGIILFTNGGSLYRVPDTGGAPTLVAAPDAARHEVAFVFPQFLPDGRRFILQVFTPGNQTSFIAAGSLDSKTVEHLAQAGSDALYAPPGSLFYLDQGALMARPFDARALRFTGPAVPVAENVGWVGGGGTYGFFSVSPAGVLAYQTTLAAAANEMTWFNRAGEKLGTIGRPGVYSTPALSPDGAKLTVGVGDLNKSDIWVYDLKRGTGSRLTFNAAGNENPVWSADGTRVYFSSPRNDQYDIYQIAASGLGSTQPVFQSGDQAKAIDDLTTDGRYAIYDTAAGAGATQLWGLPLFGDRKPFAFVQGGFAAVSAQFSPNGRYVAYTSNETGRNEIYVQTFPEHAGKWQISASGGTEPMWRRDGRELFYLTPDEKLMSVSVDSDSATFQAGTAKPLFQGRLIPPWYWRNIYVPSPDGQRFLMLTPAGDAKPEPITVVVNWPALLKGSSK